MDFQVKHFASKSSWFFRMVLCLLIVDTCSHNPRRIVKAQHSGQIPGKPTLLVR